MTTVKRFAFSLFLTFCFLLTNASAQTPPEPQAADEPTPQAVDTITGQGTSGKIAKFNGTNSIANSIITELSSKIGIGTASPGFKLTVTGAGKTVLNVTNNSPANPGNSAITGTGGIGSTGVQGAIGGAGVVGQGGKGGDSDDPNVGGKGGSGVVGIGGAAGTGLEDGTGGVGVHGIGGTGGMGFTASGVLGSSTSGAGVEGSSDTGPGVFGHSTSGIALYGFSSGGHAGYFAGKVEIYGNTLIPFETLSFGNTTRQMINLYNTGYGIGVQTGTQYLRSGGSFAWYRGGVHNNAANNPGAGGTLLMRLNASGDLYTKGTVNPPSDRNLKSNFSAVNPQTILRRLASMPIQTWSYKADGDSVRHLGPVAQDFKAAFGLGADDKTIATVDADGVALAAIQALHQQNQELAQKVARQGDQIERLLARLRRQEARLDRVRRGRAGKVFARPSRK